MTSFSTQHACPQCGLFHYPPVTPTSETLPYSGPPITFGPPASPFGSPVVAATAPPAPVTSDAAPWGFHLVIPSDVPVDAELEGRLVRGVRESAFAIRDRLLEQRIYITPQPVMVYRDALEREDYNTQGIDKAMVLPPPYPTHYHVYGAKHGAPGGQSNGMTSFKEWLTPEDADALGFSHEINRVVTLHEQLHNCQLAHGPKVSREIQDGDGVRVYFNVMSGDPAVYSMDLGDVEVNSLGLMLLRLGRKVATV